MLNGEIMERYRLAKDWRSAGFYETENHRQIPHAVHTGLGSGRLIAITGPIGVGKTVFRHRLQDDSEREEGDHELGGSRNRGRGVSRSSHRALGICR